MSDSSGIRQTVGTDPEVQGRNHGTRLAMMLLAALWVTGVRTRGHPAGSGFAHWIRNMWTGPADLPQTEARALPERSMAVDAPRIMNRREARTALTNPLDETPETIAAGKVLYDGLLRPLSRRRRRRWRRRPGRLLPADADPDRPARP